MVPCGRRTIEMSLSKGVVYLLTVPRQSLSLKKHLRETQVELNSTINLEAEFFTAGTFYWYKENQQLYKSNRITINNNKNHSELIIHKVLPEDEGLYYVVCKSDLGVTSGFANVTVIHVNTPRRAPQVEDYLPENLSIIENEESRFVCKIKADQKVQINWYRGEQNVNDDDSIICENYGGNFIGIRWKNAAKKHESMYTLRLTDTETGKKTESHIMVTVTSPRQIDMPVPPPVEPDRLLEPAVAKVDARVCFQCSFTTDGYPFYYVVWHVGRHEIKRSNILFDVLSFGTQYLLYIKKLDFGMTGEVICELRRALPKSNSRLVSRTTAHLTVVPEYFLFNEMTPHYFLYGPRVYSSETRGLDVACSKPYEEEKPKKDQLLGHQILEIIFCRLEEDDYYYSDIKSSFKGLSPSAIVEHNFDFGEEYFVQYDWKVEMDDGLWFSVGIETENCTMQVLTYTVEPRFRLKKPPIGRIVRLVITAIAPLYLFVDEDIEIDLPKTTTKPVRDMESFRLQPLSYYKSKYTKIGDLLGEGAFGQVSLVHNSAGQYFAAKELKALTQQKKLVLLHEYEIMCQLNHTGLVQLYDAYADIGIIKCVLVMELLWGGELFDRIANEDLLHEPDVIIYVKQILKALRYLHKLNIAHLDLKPENIVCVSPNSNRVKLVDFGLSRRIIGRRQVHTIYGSRDYVAPEMLNFEKMSVACDMWSMGVVTYVMMSGTTPFAEDDMLLQISKTTSVKYNYDDPAFNEISDLAKNFIDQLLTRNVKERMTAEEALYHPWIRRGPPKQTSSNDMILTRHNLRQYWQTYKQKWQRLGNLMIAANRFRKGAADRKSSLIKLFSKSETIEEADEND